MQGIPDDVFDWASLVSNLANTSSRKRPSAFRHLRAYHLCRTDDVQSYYRCGIQLAPRGDLERRFREIFAEFSPSDLEQAITRFPVYKTPRHVYVGVDFRFLLRYCGHYCIYGSEYITGLAARLRPADGIDYRQRLKRIGRPTVIVLHIPFAELPPEDASGVLEELQQVESGNMRNVVVPDMLLDYGISFDGSLPPEWVVDHFHPPNVRDPYLKTDYVFNT